MDPLEAIGGGAGVAAIAAAVGAVVQRWLASRSADRKARLDHDGLVAPPLLERIDKLEARDAECERQLGDLTDRVERAEERTAECERKHEAAEQRADGLEREIVEIGRLTRGGRSTPPAPEATATGVTVLVVDDDEQTRGSLCRLVSALGHHAVPAAAADEARAILSLERIDVALVDWHMPGVDGAELVASMRRTRRPRRTALIMITGDPEHAPALGIPVLGKPIALERLASAIAGALEDTGQHVLPGR